MENDLLEFSNILIKDAKNRKINETTDDWIDKQITYTFYLAYKSNYSFSVSRPTHCIIELDKEDIEYFKNKYLPKLEEEFNNKLSKLKEDYGQ